MQLRNIPQNIKQYLIVTGNYWAFTLTDGALRMLVVLYFHQLGYNPLEIAMLFLFYEIFGVVTNLIGGWLGARIGLNRTMNIGLGIQIVALLMLVVPTHWLTVPYVMAAQALSGIAKDLNKMSAKSAIKAIVKSGEEGTLFKWVAILTGSKNALKGVGFFLGGLLLTLLGFTGAMWLMAIMLLLVWLFSLISLKSDLGKAKSKPKFSDVFSKSRAINMLSAARLFLFAARDVWFVVALPVFLSQQFGWDHWWVGGFMATWVIGYGIVQSTTPRFISRDEFASTPSKVSGWALYLAAIPLLIAISLQAQLWTSLAVVGGLLLFAFVFAINSSLHSYLIVSLADSDGVSLDVGFYYMANAIGRLLGTVLSGWIFLEYGLVACLVVSSVMLLLAGIISCRLPRRV
ncbi:organoarsenical effux MFS transporter ArsJ [Pseudoalteromonas sp. L23]|uniref:organoarsenical effux MFS transporter ArsJ n=1 Tax=unclassified Pseudoalteromonas TaxID=194690 RepID=UPI001EF0359B|nr:MULTISPECIES: organoarsenical effux MFS transporter ArsJ [unclassified Pseudoalteromonas]MCF7513611.1 organoarsenical effux MFS transporter ArsJ [Pseudoalteromonas sp. L7]MCF7525412.1 organoarsenical effux MFS transporter ArsJ [Pseudoalteromonas sp. L23]MCX2766075.1 organoarsenical effux MFS transporter ArsJ [Pseudoalteromonas sp. B530]